MESVWLEGCLPLPRPGPAPWCPVCKSSPGVPLLIRSSVDSEQCWAGLCSLGGWRGWRDGSVAVLQLPSWRTGLLSLKPGQGFREVLWTWEACGLNLEFGLLPLPSGDWLEGGRQGSVSPECGATVCLLPLWLGEHHRGQWARQLGTGRARAPGEALSWSGSARDPQFWRGAAPALPSLSWSSRARCPREGPPRPAVLVRGRPCPAILERVCSCPTVLERGAPMPTILERARPCPAVLEQEGL